MAKKLLILSLVTKLKLYIGLPFLYVFKLAYERVKQLDLYDMGDERARPEASE